MKKHYRALAIHNGLFYYEFSIEVLYEVLFNGVPEIPLDIKVKVFKKDLFYQVTLYSTSFESSR